MNTAQFKRLTIVLAFPLFLCGVAFYHTVLPSSGFTFMICSPDGSCREMRYMERERVESDRKHYLDIWFFEQKAPVDFYMEPISTEGRIISTTPLFGVDTDFEFEDRMAQRLLGQDAAFLLGGNRDALSSIHGQDIYLRCNNMSFEQGAEVISARCSGDGWQKIVHFTPVSDQTTFFTNLYANIKATTRAKQATEMAIQVATYFSVLLIYGLLSAVTAAAILGYRYVRHGVVFQDLP
ncbi:hypothetical protein [Ruegeria sp. HKCCA4008]|uniref:hypothetical protein n=1 Tax=Ruegeria sp. HKCCA4008 TaxID=2682999 RepID=UPI001C2BB3F2|nr:hypothetical protein [Ruegeria sp. HKCCA4008]